jgi:CHAT domain-containing protein
MGTRSSNPLLRTFVVINACLVVLFATLTALSAQTRSRDARDLRPGESIEREITGREIHRYTFDLSPDEFFHVRVEQMGADVTLAILDTEDHVLAEMDSPNGKEGLESISFIAKRAGKFILSISGTDEKAGRGSYIILRASSRSATPQDVRRIQVERAFNDAIKESNTKDTALRFKLITNLQEARRGWEDIHERYLVALTSQEIERLQRLQRNERADQMLSEAVRSATPLPVDKPIVRPLWDDEGYHAYTATLPAGGVVRIKLREMGVNVFVTLTKNQTPFPKQPLVWSNFGVGFGRETATLIAPEAGEYVVLLSAIRGLPVRGSYELVGEVTNAANDNDRKRMEVEKLNRESIPVRNSGTSDSIKKALDMYERALILWKGLDEPWFAADMEERIGSSYFALGDRQKALDQYKRVLLIWNQLGDKYGQSTTLNSIGHLYSALQDKDKALSYFEQALALAKQIDDKVTQAEAVGSIGDIYATRGETRKALDLYRQALELRQGVRAVGAEATSFSGLGITYVKLGEYQKGLENFEQSFMLSLSFNDKRGMARGLSNMGVAFSYLNDPTKALHYHQRALPLVRELGDKRSLAMILNNIGEIDSTLHRTSEALQSLEEARQIFRSLNHRNGEASTLLALGNLSLEAGDTQQALRYFTDAAPLSIFYNSAQEPIALTSIMKAYAEKKADGAAIFFGKLAVNKLQARRLAIQNLDTDAQQSYLRTVKASYVKLAEALIRTDQLSEAVQIINLYRDQQFYDFNHDSLDASKQVALSERETKYASFYEQATEKIRKSLDLREQFRLRVHAGQLSESESKEQQQLEEDLKANSDGLVSLLQEISSAFSNPADAADEVQPATEVSGLQKALNQVSSANKKTVAIYTVSGEKQLTVLMVTPTEIKAFSSLITNENLQQKILDFYALLQAPKYDPRPLGLQLYNLILKPAEAALRATDAKTIVWGLDGDLRYLPMAALSPDGKGYLIDQYESVEFTRSNPERITRENNPVWTGVGFAGGKPRSVDLLKDGDTIELGPLPGATAWLQSNKRLINGDVFLDEKFTETQFYQVLARHPQLVHVDSHFVFRPGDDTRSFLLLGDGSPLTLNTLKGHKDLFAGVEMLTLAACDTAASQPDANGREIDGFAELAQRLGASSVMGTLWEVAEGSTHWLLQNFYTVRQASKRITKAEALRQAQLALLRGAASPQPGSERAMGNSARAKKVVVLADCSKANLDTMCIAPKDAPLFVPDSKKPFAHPYYWAPFILIGNWK